MQNRSRSRSQRRNRSRSRSQRRNRSRTISRSHHRSRSRSLRRKRHGGSGAANPSTYSSAATYALASAGDANTQFKNVFVEPTAHRGNGLVGLEGQWVGGRRRRRRSRSKSISRTKSRSRTRSRSRKQKGGFWNQVISNALTPLALLTAQQTYPRKKRN